MYKLPVNYANRSEEFSAIDKKLLSGENVVFLFAGRAYGITSFLRTYCDRQRNDFVEALYLSASSRNDFTELLLRELVKTQHLNNLQKFVDEKYGLKPSSLTASAAKAIPYAGELAAYFISAKQASPVYAGFYSSIFEEILIPFINTYLKKTKIVIAIDHAQEITEESHSVIVNLLMSCQAKIIFAITENDESFLKLKNHITDYNNLSCAKVVFEQPHINLVKELGTLYGYNLSKREAETILSKSAQNIHSIVECIKNVSNDAHIGFTAVEKAIVSFLHICSFPVPQKTINTLIEQAGQFFTSSNDLGDEYRHLGSIGVISQTDSGYTLDSLHHPDVEKCLSSIADMLYYKRVVYDYYHDSDSYKNADVLSLLYRLSVQLQLTTTQKYARSLLFYLLKVGKALSNDIIESAKLSNKNEMDCVITSILRCKERNYKTALTCLEGIGETTLNHLGAYKAVLLNRTRDISAAQALEECITTESNHEVKNLLLSFLLSDFLHSEKMNKAQELFDYYSPYMQEARNYGYFARNAASAYKGVSPHYDIALAAFERDNDLFGYYSTLCNKGYALCLQEQFSEAINCLKEAEAGMLEFGHVNMHILFNDLGIFYLLNDDPREAHKYLNLATQFAKNSMPYIFSNINLAVFYATQGNQDKGLSLMRSLKSDVNAQPLKRVKQKYFINSVMIELLSGNRKVSQLLTQASRYPDRYNPEKTTERIGIYRQMIKEPLLPPFNWKDFYSPCGLVYWYVDPLKVIPECVLNQIGAVHT